MSYDETELAAMRAEVKQFLVTTLKLQDIDPSEIGDFDPLFGEGVLSLDSLDAAEIAVHLQHTYGPRINDINLATQVLQSVDTLAKAILDHRRENGEDAPAGAQ